MYWPQEKEDKSNTGDLQGRTDSDTDQTRSHFGENDI